MTEKRFELKVNQHNQCDIVDWVESKEKNAICIYNDLGDYYFSSAKALCKLLNELHEENQRLTDKLNQTALELVDEVISQGKAVEISEMSYSEFLDYRAENGKPMELQI